MSKIPSFAVLSVLLSLLAPIYAGDSPLADAAEANNAKRVKELISLNADIDAAQVDGMTALHWACHNDNTEIALALLAANANPSSKNRYEVTPLSIACSNGNATIIDRLLEKGADPNTTLDGGETALMTAARVGKLKPVLSLLEAGAAVDSKEQKAQTAIIWAANEGHAAIVKALAKAGADFKTPLKSGYTPLFFAVRQGHREAIHTLIELGADFDGAMEIENSGGKLAKNGTSPMILAMENGHFDIALEFLKMGADPNDMRTGITPLHTLVRVRKPDRGEGAQGEPPPLITGPIDSLEFARELIAHGAKVDVPITTGRKPRGGRLNMIGCTPFFLACDTADLAYMKLLIEAGADPTIRNVDNATALMVAAGLGSHAPEEEAGTPAECLKAVEYLVSLGADVNAIDNRGETAMHGAAYKNAPEVVTFLASQGADISIWNTKNESGWTPLYIAEGYRPGNFKPSFPTVDAIAAAMLAQGVPFPTEERPKAINYQ